MKSLSLDEILAVEGFKDHFNDQRNYAYLILNQINTNYYLPYLENVNMVLDIGANCGLFSQYAASFAKVVAVEPMPHLIQLLTRLNHEKKLGITIEQAAVSAEDGEAEFFVAKDNFTMNSLLSKDFHSESIKVNTISIETLINKYGPVDFIKFDAEGGEVCLLDLKPEPCEHIKKWLIEVHEWAGITVQQIADKFTDLGYKVSVNNDLVYASR